MESKIFKLNRNVYNDNKTKIYVMLCINNIYNLYF